MPLDLSWVSGETARSTASESALPVRPAYFMLSDLAIQDPVLLQGPQSVLVMWPRGPITSAKSGKIKQASLAGRLHTSD